METPKTSYPKEKIRILFLDNINESAVKFFRSQGYTHVDKLSKSLPEEELIKEIKDVHILGIRSKTRITKNVLDAARKLQVIGCFCAGINHVDLKTATQKGVVVFNAPYSNTRSVAELVIGAAIMLLRRVPDKDRAAHNGVWMKDSKESYELRGKTLGIIGYGNIGMQVSVMAEALGMKVIFYDEQTKLPLGTAQEKKSLKELMGAADVITMHMPETSQTKNFINKTTLKYCKKGCILINFARGRLIDAEALREAILEGYIGGAAIDVFPDEPEKKGDQFVSVLQNVPNVMLTPHIGGSTEEAQQNIGEDVSAKLFSFLEKGITLGSHTVPGLMLPPHEGSHRILHIHYNVPGVLSEINTRLSEYNINILGQYLKTNDDIGYVVLDVDRQISATAFKLLKEVKQTIKVRMLY
jgi:D-3-phosphoglycerate dehydrogenase